MPDRIHAYETVLLPGHMQDDPAEPGKIYVIVGTELAARNGDSVHFQCPCGCGKEVFLTCTTPSNPRNRDPQWELKLTGPSNLVTLHPSIRDRGSCKSHYHIKEGKVEWCE